jgi:hypothetical protein
MDRTTLGFVVLLSVLFVGQVFVREQFADISDNSGSRISLSLTDLLSLIGTSTTTTPSSTPSATPIVINQGGGDYSYYKKMKKAILGDVRQTVRDELLNGSLSAINSSGCSGDTITDSCIDSFSDQQGADFMRFIPGKNPADYIRKDSVPCYGCSVPN